METGDIFKNVCTGKRDVDPEALEQTIVLASKAAQEGRDERRIGTLFVIDD